MDSRLYANDLVVTILQLTWKLFSLWEVCRCICFFGSDSPPILSSSRHFSSFCIFVFCFVVAHWVLLGLLAWAQMWVYLLIHGQEVTPLKKNHSPHCPGATVSSFSARVEPHVRSFINPWCCGTMEVLDRELHFLWAQVGSSHVVFRKQCTLPTICLLHSLCHFIGDIFWSVCVCV